MNAALRTRLLAVIGAGTLAGVLGGTGIAFARPPAMPQAEGRPTATCQLIPQAEERFEGMWFGYTHHAAQ